MNRKSKLVATYARLGVVNLLDKANHIAASLQPQPSKVAAVEIPFYDDLLTAIADLQDCNERYKTNNTLSLEREQLRKNVIDILNKIKAFLEAYYSNDGATLATTGYDLAKIPQPIPEPGVPIDFAIKATHVGTVDLKVKSMKGAKSYEFCYRANNTDQWISFTQSSAKCTLRGLTSGEKYDFKVAYVGKTPNKIYSTVLSTFIL